MNASKAFQDKVKAQQAEDRRQERLQQLRAEQQAELDQQLADEARDEQRRADAAARDKELTDALDLAAAKHAAFLATFAALAKARRKTETSRAAQLIALHDAQRQTRKNQQAATDKQVQSAGQRRADARTQRIASRQAATAKQQRAASATGEARAATRTQQQHDARRSQNLADQKTADKTAARTAAATTQQRDARKAAAAGDAATAARSDAAATARRSAATADQKTQAAAAQKTQAAAAQRAAANAADRRSAAAGQQKAQAAAVDQRTALAQTRRDEDRVAAQSVARAAAARGQRSQTAAADDRRRASQQALRASAARSSAASRPAYETVPLPWLDASPNGLVDIDGNPIWLRGVSVDIESFAAPFDEATLQRWTTDWSINVVRLAYRFADLSGPLGDLALNALDTVVNDLAGGGAYTLLAVRASSDQRPGADVVALWQRLATRYAESSSVLFEIGVPAAPSSDLWPQAAWPILGAVTDLRPGSLFFVPIAPSNGIARSILRFQDGTPAPNVVYALGVNAASISTIASSEFQKDVAAIPAAFTEWSDGDPAALSAHDSVSRLLYRNRLAFCAKAADMGPQATSRFALTVRRTFALEPPPQLSPYPLV